MASTVNQFKLERDREGEKGTDFTGMEWIVWGFGFNNL